MRRNTNAVRDARWRIEPSPGCRSLYGDAVTTQPPPADDDLIALLQERDGLVTTLRLRDGRRLDVRNIAWGYDDGDEHAHVTTNISPDVRGTDIFFFYTHQVQAVLGEAGELLWGAQLDP